MFLFELNKLKLFTFTIIHFCKEKVYIGVFFSFLINSVRTVERKKPNNGKNLIFLMSVVKETSSQKVTAVLLLLLF